MRKKAWKKKETDSEWTSYTAPKDLAEHLAREIDFLERAYKHGNKGAILEAVVLCGEAGQRLPRWLASALIAIVKDWLKKPEGRNGRSWLKQHKQDMIDFTRYDTVQEARDHGIRWIDVYHVAADLLSGGGGEGSSETIKQSYSRVKNQIKNNPGLYKTLKTVRGAPQEPPALSPKDSALLWRYIKSLRSDSD